MTMPGPVFLTEIGTRLAISDRARAMIGFGSTGPRERQVAYEEHLFPHPDDDRFQEAMADAMYSCGLHARSCLYEARVGAPELGAPYHRSAGAILAWLETVARRMNAFRSLLTAKDVAALSPDLDFGDVIVVGETGPTHVIVLVERLENGDFVTSEGGSPEIGTHKDGTGSERGMGIKSRVMRVRKTAAGRLQTGTVNPDGSVVWGRIVLSAISAKYLVRTDE